MAAAEAPAEPVATAAQGLADGGAAPEAAADADSAAATLADNRGGKERQNNGLSACAARRLRKEQRAEERRETVGDRRKEKRLGKKARRQEARKQLLDSMTAEEREAFLEKERETGRVLKAEAQASLDLAYESGRPKVVINCSFSDCMSFKELTSLAKQAQLSYTHVRDLRSTIQLHLTSITADNPALHSLELIGFRGWTIHLHEKPYWELFELDKLVILSPDAEEDLDAVEEDKTYIIGGLVDRSVRKTSTYGQAREHGALCLRKLPIKKFGPPGAQPVLNIDTVVRILAERMRRDDWSAILADCLPFRKSGQLTARQLKKQRQREARLARAEGADEAGGEAAEGEDGAGSSDDESGSSGASAEDGGAAESAEPAAPAA